MQVDGSRVEGHVSEREHALNVVSFESRVAHGKVTTWRPLRTCKKHLPVTSINMCASSFNSNLDPRTSQTHHHRVSTSLCQMLVTSQWRAAMNLKLSEAQEGLRDA